MKFLVFSIFAACFAISFAENARYDGYHIYSVNIENDQQLNVLRELQDQPDGVKFQTPPSSIGQIVHLIVPPHKVADLLELFEANKFRTQIRTINLQSMIDAGQPLDFDNYGDFGWNNYYNLSTVYGWLDQMLEKYPQVLTSYNFGKSYEGRPLRAVKVSHKKGNPTIFIESTIHPPEWITVSVGTYFLNELITSNRTDIRHLADNYDWVFVPVFNVDGYEYTHTTDKGWRKNRRPNPTHPDCIGVDLNRNFDSHHGGPGAEGGPCSHYYAGSKPFSEIETKSLSEFIKTFDVKMYLSLHSFGQFLVFPTGYSKEHVRNYDDLLKIGLKGRSAIFKRDRRNYAVGAIAETIYRAPGNSIDWVYDSLGVPLSYTIELRGRFPSEPDVPTDQIIPNALEIIDGLVAMTKEAKALNYL